MKTKAIVFATAAVLSLLSAAHAQDNNDRRATPAPIAAPAPSGTEVAIPAPSVPSATPVVASVPEGCKLVTFKRPNINPSKPEIYLTLRGYGASVEAIQACNTESMISAGTTNVFGVVSSPTAGARVSIRTKNGIGVVGLPVAYNNGDVHQVHCQIVDRAIKWDFYRATWSGLPSEVNLVKSDFDAATAMNICNGALTPDLRAQLAH